MPIRRYNADMKANKSDSCNVTEEIREAVGSLPFPHHPLGPVKSAFLDTRLAMPWGRNPGWVIARIGIPPGISGNREALLQHVPHTSLGFFAYVLAFLAHPRLGLRKVICKSPGIIAAAMLAQYEEGGP